jgi:hypothetical protein
MLTFTILPFVFATLAVATTSLTSRQVPDTALREFCMCARRPRNIAEI